MTNVLIDLSKYIMVIFILYYTISSYISYQEDTSLRKYKQSISNQRVILFLFHLIGFMVLYIQTFQESLIILYVQQLIMFSLVFKFYPLLYKDLSKNLLNNMCFLLMIGFVMLTRLSIGSGTRHFYLSLFSIIITLGIPYILKRMRKLDRIPWFYALSGLLLLLFVLIFGSEKYGARSWLVIGSFNFQPSEFVKILFIFYLASGLSRAKNFVDIVVVSLVTLLHLGAIILQKDLGAALIFFIVYLVMLYVSTGNKFYFVGGLSSASIVAWIMAGYFTHVQVRVEAWLNPWKDITGRGYQIAQSLFAIGTGGWFGLGLFKGMPNKIPMVETDMIFSAIAEELGSIVGICIILIILNTYLLSCKIAEKAKTDFYKLVALGISTCLGFQVFLIIGGSTKLIPLTGVTLPLISYGGSSLLSTIIMCSVLQGIVLATKKRDDNEQEEEAKK